MPPPDGRRNVPPAAFWHVIEHRVRADGSTAAYRLACERFWRDAAHHPLRRAELVELLACEEERGPRTPQRAGWGPERTRAWYSAEEVDSDDDDPP
jgi:hypothetical protein